jgi:hypothetical protein
MQISLSSLHHLYLGFSNKHIQAVVEVYDVMDTMVDKFMEITSQEVPSLYFVEADFAKPMRPIIDQSQNCFNNPLHTLAHALNLKFYNENLIV